MFVNLCIKEYRIMRLFVKMSANINKLKMYEEAIVALNGLQSNAATLERARQQRDKFIHLRLAETATMASRANIKLEDIDQLSVIHVSGTKGKGSTCAFTESILRHHGFKTGFFSSPHLVEVRERIRINGQPISKQAFTDYFWDVYTRLNDTKAEHDNQMPPYFKFLTILAFHVFLQEQVDVAIMEVGIGGQYDCTNIIRHPVVCGVSSLGFDHQSILGYTIDKIAWQKGGIFKPGAPAVTVEQPEAAMEVLKERAVERQCHLYLAPDYRSYGNLDGLQLGIVGNKQTLNASLALQLAKLWMENRKLGLEERLRVHREHVDSEGKPALLNAEAFPLTDTYRTGLERCRWAGRNQVVRRERVTYYLDGAHTTSSIEQCADWFHKTASKEEIVLGVSVARVLLFNVTGERSPHDLLQYFLDLDFDAVVFCPNVTGAAKSQADQENMMVSRTSQIRRCQDCKDTWDQLTTARADFRSPRLPHSDLILQLASHLSSVVGLSGTKEGAGDGLNLSGYGTQIAGDGGHPGGDECVSDSGFSSARPDDLESSGAGSLPSSSPRTSPLADYPCSGYVFASISDALQWVSRGSADIGASVCDAQCRALPAALEHAQHVQLLCTGSLHLVGGLLALLDPNLNCMFGVEGQSDVTSSQERSAVGTGQ